MDKQIQRMLSVVNKIKPIMQPSNCKGNRQGEVILEEIVSEEVSEQIIFKQSHEWWKDPITQWYGRGISEQKGVSANYFGKNQLDVVKEIASPYVS